MKKESFLLFLCPLLSASKEQIVENENTEKIESIELTPQTKEEIKPKTNYVVDKIFEFCSKNIFLFLIIVFSYFFIYEIIQQNKAVLEKKNQAEKNKKELQERKEKKQIKSQTLQEITKEKENQSKSLQRILTDIEKEERKKKNKEIEFPICLREKEEAEKDIVQLTNEYYKLMIENQGLDQFTDQTYDKEIKNLLIIFEPPNNLIESISVNLKKWIKKQGGCIIYVKNDNQEVSIYIIDITRKNSWCLNATVFKSMSDYDFDPPIINIIKKIFSSDMKSQDYKEKFELLFAKIIFNFKTDVVKEIDFLEKFTQVCVFNRTLRENEEYIMDVFLFFLRDFYEDFLESFFKEDQHMFYLDEDLRLKNKKEGQKNEIFFKESSLLDLLSKISKKRLFFCYHSWITFNENKSFYRYAKKGKTFNSLPFSSTNRLVNYLQKAQIKDNSSNILELLKKKQKEKIDRQKDKFNEDKKNKTAIEIFDINFMEEVLLTEQEAIDFLEEKYGQES